MNLIVKKWGNSLGIRIPKKIAEAGNLKVDQEICIEATDGKIIITPVAPRVEYSLDDLLNQCPADGVPMDEEDRAWLNAEPVGKELV